MMFDGRTFVVTRRRSLESGAAGVRDASESTVRWAAVLLAEATAQIDRDFTSRPLPAVPGHRPPHPVRLYVVSEDGTLISAPWERSTDAGEASGHGGLPTPEISSQSAAERELLLLSARPGLPTFAPEEFFFRARRARHGRRDRRVLGLLSRPRRAWPRVDHHAAADRSERSPCGCRPRPRVRDRLATIRGQCRSADQRCRGAGGRWHARVLGLVRCSASIRRYVGVARRDVSARVPAISQLAITHRPCGTGSSTMPARWRHFRCRNRPGC